MAAADRIHDRPGPEKESRRQKRGRKEPQRGEAEKQTQRRAGEGQWNLQYPCQRKGKRRKRKIVIIPFEVLILLSVIILQHILTWTSWLSGMSRLDWNPDEIKT